MRKLIVSAQRAVPSWPFRPDDEITQSTGIVLSSGHLLSTVFGLAKKQGLPLPKSRQVPHRGQSIRVFRWGDVEAWLAEQGLTALGPRGATGKGNQEWEEFNGLKHLVAAISTERDNLRRDLDVSTIKNQQLERHFVSMVAKVPGLLAGVEILARSVETAAITMPGIYFLIDGFEIVYVGQSADLPSRIRTHVAQKEKRFNRVFVLRCGAHELDRIERAYIEALQPKYNKTFANKKPAETIIGDPRAQWPRNPALGRRSLPQIDAPEAT